jgi:hypothetical protein
VLHGRRKIIQRENENAPATLISAHIYVHIGAHCLKDWYGEHIVEYVLSSRGAQAIFNISSQGMNTEMNALWRGKLMAAMQQNGAQQENMRGCRIIELTGSVSEIEIAARCIRELRRLLLYALEIYLMRNI